MSMTKQQWTIDETSCLLAVWSTEEMQDKLLAPRTMPAFLEMQRVMAAAGYERTVEQISNKLKKLKRDYREQKRQLDQSSTGRIRRSLHFDLLNSVLGDGPPCDASALLKTSRTATTTAKVEVVVEVPPLPTEPESSTVEHDDANSEMTPPPRCISPTPSSSSGVSPPIRPGKRKRDVNKELLDYLEKADERFLQHSKDLNDALLRKLETNTSAFLGLMERMVSLMEAETQK